MSAAEILESRGKYDRYPTEDGESVWVCGYCGEEDVDPYEDDHVCGYYCPVVEDEDEDDLEMRKMMHGCNSISTHPTKEMQCLKS